MLISRPKGATQSQAWENGERIRLSLRILTSALVDMPKNNDSLLQSEWRNIPSPWHVFKLLMCRMWNTVSLFVSIKHFPIVRWYSVFGLNLLLMRINEFYFQLKVTSNTFPRRETQGSVDAIMLWCTERKPLHVTWGAIWDDYHGFLFTKGILKGQNPNDIRSNVITKLQWSRTHWNAVDANVLWSKKKKKEPQIIACLSLYFRKF